MSPSQMLGQQGSPNQSSQSSYNGDSSNPAPSQGQSASSGQQLAQQAQQQVQGAFQSAAQLKDQITQLAQAYPSASQDFLGAGQLCDQIQQALLQSLGNVLGAMGSSAAQPTQTQGMGM